MFQRAWRRESSQRLGRLTAVLTACGNFDFREDIAALELDYREVTEDSPEYEEYYDEI